MQINVNWTEGSEATMPLDLYPWHAANKPPETREELEARIRRDLVGGNG